LLIFKNQGDTHLLILYSLFSSKKSFVIQKKSYTFATDLDILGGRLKFAGEIIKLKKVKKHGTNTR
jgi:hypothetical protein